MGHQQSRRGLDGRTDRADCAGDLAFYGVGSAGDFHMLKLAEADERAAIHKDRRREVLRNVVVGTRKHDRLLGFIDEIHLAKER